MLSMYLVRRQEEQMLRYLLLLSFVNTLCSSNSNVVKVPKCTHHNWAYRYLTPSLKVSKDCIKDGMKISWRSQKEAVFYSVRLTISDRPNCTIFNVTGQNNMLFTRQEGFQRLFDYWVSVKSYSRKTKSEPPSKLIGIGSCPWKGEWSSWSSWNTCFCKDISKPRTRSKTCVNKSNPAIEISDIDCEGEKPTQSSDCYLKCRPYIQTSTFKPLASTQRDALPNQLGIIFGSSVTFFVVLVILLTYVIRTKRRKIPTTLSNSTTQDMSLYVTHYTKTTRDEQRLLSLVQYISAFDFQCNVDLLSQVDINNLGGLPNWIPEKILNVKKILVVLSKEYIRVLNSTTDDFDGNIGDDQEYKVQAEYMYIKTMLYHSFIRKSPQLVIVLEHDVSSNDIPTELKGLPYCLYPKRFKIPEDENSRKLIGLLLDTEPLQIITEFHPKEQPLPHHVADDTAIASSSHACVETFV